MKWALMRNDETRAVDVGFCSPFPPEIGKSVWVGSLSSRTGWTTTAVVTVSENGRSFRSRNNDYHLIPLDEYYLTKDYKERGRYVLPRDVIKKED